jgi:hypothetical protein
MYRSGPYRELIRWMKATYGEVKTSAGPVAGYLGMMFDLSGEARITMNGYVDDMLKEDPRDQRGRRQELRRWIICSRSVMTTLRAARREDTSFIGKWRRGFAVPNEEVPPSLRDSSVVRSDTAVTRSIAVDPVCSVYVDTHVLVSWPRPQQESSVHGARDIVPEGVKLALVTICMRGRACCALGLFQPGHSYEKSQVIPPESRKHNGAAENLPGQPLIYDPTPIVCGK